MIARKSISIVLVISLLMVFGCGKAVISEKEKPRSFPQTFPEGVPKEIIKEDGANMVLIPAGEFMMGTSNAEKQALINLGWWHDWFNNEMPEHSIYLNAFYIDKYEVTNAQYAEFLKAYGKNFDTAGHQLLDINDSDCLIEKVGNTYKPKMGYENHPVIEVSWYGAAAYAQFYGKRLPTEAEWEKAARGGLVCKRFPWGNDITHDGANYWKTGGRDKWERTFPVGSFPPNDYGLFDMAGNVWEWCADEFDAGYYSNSPKNNPKGPGVPITFRNDDFTNVKTSLRQKKGLFELLFKRKSFRVLRGGSWYSDYVSRNLRCAGRDGSDAYDSSFDFGFRCAQDF